MLEAQLESNPYKLMEKPHKNSKWWLLLLPAILYMLIMSASQALTNPEAPVWIFPLVLLITLPWLFLLPTMVFRYYTLELDTESKTITTTYKLFGITRIQQFSFSDVDLISVKAKYVSSSSTTDTPNDTSSKYSFTLSIRKFNGKTLSTPFAIKSNMRANDIAKTLAIKTGCRVETWAPRTIYSKPNQEI